MSATGRCDANILLRQVEVIGIGVLQTRLVPGLTRKPVEESLQIREGPVQCCLAQLSAGLGVDLGRKPSFECDSLLEVECLEISIFGHLFEA